MKRFFTLVAATALAALSLISSKSYGSHAVGADVTYTYVGPNQYLITVRFYRDCAGITAPTSVSVNYTSSCFPGGFLTLNAVPGTGQEIPPSPCLPQVTTACNGGSGYGVQEWVYQGLVTLGGPCADWTFSFSMCCRNAQITTVVNPDFYSLYVSTTLDNFNYPVNSSPVFANIPVTQFCVGNQFFYNQGATDADGDSLVFLLAPAEDAANVYLPYAAGYGALQPIASSTPITIDPQTGTISFTPSQVQVGVIAVVCEEYRNGVKIGQVKRDIQMNVVGNCIGSTPSFANPVDPQGNPAPYYTAQCGDTSIYIVLLDPIQCGSVVPTDIRILTPQGQLNPVTSITPINCVNGLTDSLLVTFFYPLTVGTTYAFTKVGFDNNTFLSECGVQMAEFDSIPFNVIDPGIFDIESINVGCAFNDFTITFDYEIACNTLTGTGSEFFLVDGTGATFPVTAVGNCPGGNSYSATITFTLGASASPANPLYLIVQDGTDQNTFTNRCGTFITSGDTIAQLNVQNNLIVDLGADLTLCDTDPLPVLDAGITGATYSWTLNGNPLPDITQTIVATQSGTYSVSVGVTPVCQGTDNIVITIVPSPVVALGNDITLCDTDPLPLLDAGNPGATYQWFDNGVAITGATNQTFQPTVPGTYSVTVSVGTSCSGTDDITITANPSLVIALGADQTICSSGQPPLLDSGVPGGTYSWTLNGSPVGNTQTLQTTGPGVYSVTVTSVSGCTGTDDFVLNVVQDPVVTLASATVCPGAAFPVLDAGNPGATYQWSTGETTQTINPNAPGTYTVTVTNSASGVNCTATASATYTNANPVIVSLGGGNAICEGNSQVIDAGNPGSTYAWSNGATTQAISATQGGTYSVVVTDANGCTGTDTYTLTVNPNPVVELGADTSLCESDPFPLLDATTPNASTYSWEFNGSVVGNGPTLQTTEFGTYNVTVDDLNGCRGTDFVQVIDAPCAIEIPNVITPENGDGKNDVFFIKNLDSNPNSQLTIFNRWGNEVYSNADYQNDWNGDDLPHGTYYYVLLLQNGKDYKGTLTIIREKK
jgi:gliding motility-associated-like protein